uniref:Inactive dipeptidyl peptidase 10 n=1 Tax=Oncorhynchus mykiss TaxID=8022 RepID=A0A8K9Y648_ONCMY
MCYLVPDQLFSLSLSHTHPHTHPHTPAVSNSESQLTFTPEVNWKGIAISLLVIMVILSLIGLTSCHFFTDDGAKSLGTQLTLDDLFQREFQVHDPDAKWINGMFMQYIHNSTYLMSLVSVITLYLSQMYFATFKASKFAVSPDLNFVLLGYDVKQVYRYSFLASYLIYNLHTREVQELNPPEVSDSVLQFASWGVRDQQLVYVFENNIYYQTDVKSSSWRLTSSGQEGVVFNGIADWLYEEEVLHSQVAHWWSPDGSRLAYLNLNDTLVPNMLLPRFTGALYPRGQLYPYPKVGQVNPTVKLYVVTLDGGSQTTELRPPNSFEKRYQLNNLLAAYHLVFEIKNIYIIVSQWPFKIGVRWLNRAQNTSILSLCEVTMGACLKVSIVHWLHSLFLQNEEPLFSKDGNTFFLTMPIKHGGRGSFHHITMISDQGPSSQDNLTLTSYRIVFSRLLSIRVSAVNPFQRECLTCSLFKTQCSYYDAVFNQDYQYVLDSAPGGQAVSDQFVLDWDSVLVSSDNVIVARLDGSGSGFLGQRVLHEVHQRLGTVEVQDQIAAVEYLTKLPYVDKNKVAVYGKAYGGFLSSLLLLSSGSMFRCGVAVAPVTDWRLYGNFPV